MIKVWIERIKVFVRFKHCPVCGYVKIRRSNYCTHCGIKNKDVNKVLKMAMESHV